MTDSYSTGGQNWLEDWLSSQRKLAEQWQGSSEAERMEATRKTAEALWQGVIAHASPETQAVARQLQDFTQTTLAGTGYFMQGMTDLPSMMEIPHRAQQLFKAVPLGFAREHQIALQKLLQANEDHQALTIRMVAVLTQLEADTVELLTQRAQALSDSGKAADSGRALYDLWVECGEETFAKLAHDSTFVELQGELVNSLVRLRMRQRVLLDYLLRQFDLPTRAELNTVHQKLKQLTERLAAIESQDRSREPSSRTQKARKSPTKRSH